MGRPNSVRDAVLSEEKRMDYGIWILKALKKKMPPIRTASRKPFMMIDQVVMVSQQIIVPRKIMLVSAGRVSELLQCASFEISTQEANTLHGQ